MIYQSDLWLVLDPSLGHLCAWMNTYLCVQGG